MSPVVKTAISRACAHLSFTEVSNNVLRYLTESKLVASDFEDTTDSVLQSAAQRDLIQSDKTRTLRGVSDSSTKAATTTLSRAVDHSTHATTPTIVAQRRPCALQYVLNAASSRLSANVVATAPKWVGAAYLSYLAAVYCLAALFQTGYFAHAH